MSNANPGASGNVQSKPPQPQPPAPVASVNDQIKDPNKKDSRNFLQNASHPGVCFSLIFVKCVALGDFLLLSLFIDNEAMVYLTVVILGAADFWITKNVAGRRLVGLRWWNEVKENGEEVWIFESKNEKLENSVDKKVFWISLYGSSLAWLLLFIYEVITLTPSWALITFAMLVFSATNLYGYFKCSKDQKNKIKGFGKDIIKKGATAGLEAATK